MHDPQTGLPSHTSLVKKPPPPTLLIPTGPRSMNQAASPPLLGLEAIRAPKPPVLSFWTEKYFSLLLRAEQSKAKQKQTKSTNQRTKQQQQKILQLQQRQNPFLERGMAKAMSSDLSLEGARE